MSVSKFGNSSDKSPTSLFDKKYIDQKFMTLSTNLAVKLEKSGDTLTGDLYLSCENDHERSFGVKGISEGKSVGLLLGDLRIKFITILDIRYSFLLFMVINSQVLVAMFVNWAAAIAQIHCFLATS